jgi:hypothetical protein
MEKPQELELDGKLFLEQVYLQSVFLRRCIGQHDYHFQPNEDQNSMVNRPGQKLQRTVAIGRTLIIIYTVKRKIFGIQSDGDGN